MQLSRTGTSKIQVRLSNMFTVSSAGMKERLVLYWYSEDLVEIVNYLNNHIHFKVQSSSSNESVGSSWGFMVTLRHIKDQFLGLCYLISTQIVISLCASLVTLMKILNQDEKNGGRRRPINQMEAFREAIIRNRLNDIGWRGQKFTMSNHHTDETFIKERLDRAIVNQHWSELYGHEVVEVLIQVNLIINLYYLQPSHGYKLI